MATALGYIAAVSSLERNKRKRDSDSNFGISSASESEETVFQEESSSSDNEIEPAVKRRKLQKSPSNALTLVNGELVSTKSIRSKRYRCTFKGCDKAYTKPSRLQEHERSHTGERPYHCTFANCGKSYLRESHLQAHNRTHLPQSDRPHLCLEQGCGKKFWTSTQLKVHDAVHRGERPFLCTHPNCNETFPKNHQLRAHIAAAHCPPGTKSFRCEHEECRKSFSTNQKLKSHVKVHQANRYMCTDPKCLGSNSAFYQTWTFLQAHIRNDHPPTCPYEGCGRTFSSQKNMKAHLKVHQDRDLEAALVQQMDTDMSDMEMNTTEVGKDWPCEWEGCEKAFKSEKARRVHTNVVHRGERNFVCEHNGCGRAFGYKHLLQRHIAKLHGIHETPVEKETEKPPSRPLVSFIEKLTGVAYQRRAEGHSSKMICCPWPYFTLSRAQTGEDAIPVSTPRCESTFHRAYDLRRHLFADHGLHAEKEEVASWVAANHPKS